MVERLVVVGASLAGLRAVMSARRTGYEGPLTLVGGEEHLPYDRPPLSKAYLEDEQDPEPTEFPNARKLSKELDVDVRLGTWASSLDGKRKVIGLSSGEELEYHAVVIATGAAARTLPGTEGVKGVHCLRTIDDAIAIRKALDKGAQVVVVGAGFIGSEVASSARKRGLSATILEALPVPLARSVGEEIGHACADLHRDNGTDLRCEVTVSELESENGTVTGVRLKDGEVVPADLVVVGIGVSPSTQWLRGSGIKLHERDGGIVADERLGTGLPGVYAAGDVVHYPNPLFDGEMMRLEHWTNANEQGTLAAKNALNPNEAKPSAAVPYFWSDWYGHRIQFVGIPTADEIRVVSKELGEDKFLGLYRRGDRIIGAISIDRQAQIMKYRRLIAQHKSWDDALEFAGVQ